MKTVNIDDEQHKFLTDIKNKTGLPIAVQVRKALAVFIVEHYSTSKKQQDNQQDKKDD